MPQPATDDPVEVDSRHYKVEFENERVRVLRIKYGPREKSVMHSHPESISVFLTDTHGTFTYPDGRTEDITVSAGTVQHMDAFTHLPESLSVRVYGTVAIASGVFRARGLENGKRYLRHERFVDTWFLKDGRWVCIATNATPILH
jgi:hypothetical protein